MSTPAPSAAPPANSRDALAGREIIDAVNPPDLLEAHYAVNAAPSGSGPPLVRTRFPPEPNGYLHIGHAKSMNMNFRLAFEKLGVPEDRRRTVFRYDDTNPEAESTEYIASIRRDVAYMGWAPERTTYSSERFGQLYGLALDLIRQGKAYVCDMTKAQVEEQRALALRRAAARALGKDPDAEHPLEPALLPGPNRNTSVSRNLALFEKMRAGIYPEGTYTLRMKMDMESANPNMYDQVAYRIKYAPHPHAGDGWCVYPTYDFTHSLCDSLEHIDYSICTLEFETRREPYYWLLAALGMYRPKVYEMSRLNLTYTVLSKRRLLKLVEREFVRGWDDPRMPTISGLRRRGYTAEILNSFCMEVGVSRAAGFIEMERLAGMAREKLAPTCRRAMACLEPIEVVVSNHKDLGGDLVFEVQDVAADASRGAHTVEFTSTIYITAADFREDGANDKNYYGLSPGGSVGLKYFGGNLTCQKVEKTADGKTKLVCTADTSEGRKKPKSFVSWSPSTSVRCEVRSYGHLFLVQEPGDDWENELNPESETVNADALVDPSVLENGACDGRGEEGRWTSGAAFQFERAGYFVVDPDTDYDSKTKTGKIVFNRTVGLREDENKRNVAGASEDATVVAAREAEAKKLDERREGQRKQAEAKAARLKLSVEDLFRKAADYAGRFSAFDDATGVPTHGADGKGLSKSVLKKLAKERKKHEMELKKAAAAAKK